MHNQFTQCFHPSSLLKKPCTFGKSLYYGILGFVILALYGVVATLQTSNFARAYATYGGVFIVMALLFAWKVDNFKPDKYDFIGAIIAIVGVSIIMYAPRR